jgi:hypothetical protein
MDGGSSNGHTHVIPSYDEKNKLESAFAFSSISCGDDDLMKWASSGRLFESVDVSSSNMWHGGKEAHVVISLVYRHSSQYTILRLSIKLMAISGSVISFSVDSKSSSWHAIVSVALSLSISKTMYERDLLPSELEVRNWRTELLTSDNTEVGGPVTVIIPAGNGQTYTIHASDPNDTDANVQKWTERQGANRAATQQSHATFGWAYQYLVMYALAAIQTCPYPQLQSPFLNLLPDYGRLFQLPLSMIASHQLAESEWLDMRKSNSELELAAGAGGCSMGSGHLELSF